MPNWLPTVDRPGPVTDFPKTNTAAPFGSLCPSAAELCHAR